MDLTFPASIDGTMLSAFSCPQKWFQEFVIRRVPIGRSIHLHAGGCLASALESVRRSIYADGLSVQDALIKAWPDYVRNWGTMETPEKEYKDIVNMWAALEAYLQEYPPETDVFQPIILTNGQPAVEFRFAIPLPIAHPDTGDPILFAGRADMLATDRVSVYVVDEKTTKALGASWQYQWDMRGQFYGYTWAGRQMGYRVDGTLVRGIAIQQTQFGFQEKPIFFSNFQIERWHYNMLYKVNSMVAYYKRAKEEAEKNNFAGMHDSLPRNFGDICTQYGNCQFVDLCRSERPWEIWDAWEERIWDPLAKDPAAKSEDRTAKMETISLEDAARGAWS